jgi:hypothetical protein
LAGVKLPDSLSIGGLHRVIQLLMGWDADHLHRFRIHGRDYGIAYVGLPSEPITKRWQRRFLAVPPTANAAEQAAGGSRLAPVL